MNLRKEVGDPAWQPESQEEDCESFLGWAEFLRHREGLCVVVQSRIPRDVHLVRMRVMQSPTEQSVDPDASSETWASLCQLKSGKRPITSH